MPNFQLETISVDRGWLDFCTAPGLPPLAPAQAAQHRPDASLLLLDQDQAPLGRCSLWWTEPPPYPGQRPGLIGHYAARYAEAAVTLLKAACRELASQGCTLALGPIDGSTWRSYRLVTDHGSQPPFFLEPWHPVGWPIHFHNAGFSPVARYVSTHVDDLDQAGPAFAHVAQRAAARGVRLRSFNPARFEAELGRLYRLVLACFQDNLLYRPLAEAEFLALYQPLRPHLQPDLILIAERDDQPLGFCFALPDQLEAQRGQPVETVIIKTIAVHPDCQVAGLGSLLVDRCQQIARELGYRRAIHALMHEKNASLKVSGRFGSIVMRRYALFAKPL